MEADLPSLEKLTGEEVMKRVDKSVIPKDLKAVIRMKLIDRRGNIRSRILKTYRLGKDRQIVWFLSPVEVKGTSFLRISHKRGEDDMWIYLPAFGKIRRIAAHAKKGHFMGSDFIYEDLEERKLNNYHYRLLREEEIDKERCWVIESIPKRGVKTSYSKIVSWILKDKYIIIREEYYDRKKTLKKRKKVCFKKIKRYWIPEKMTMEDLKSNHKTELYFEKVEVDIGLKKKIFHPSYMKRIY